MGRACDCCGDDEALCKNGISCLSCFGEGCSYISEIDIEDAISIIVLNHNIDDRTKNNCDGDDCDFVDARYDIYIGPQFSLASVGVTDNSILSNKKDELKYSTKIGTTAPFRDSSSCSDFDPVCKCVLNRYIEVYEDRVYVTPSDGKRREHPRYIFSGDQEYTGTFGACLDCSQEIQKEGYAVISSTRNKCNELGGQFIFSDDCEVPESKYTTDYMRFYSRQGESDRFYQAAKNYVDSLDYLHVWDYSDPIYSNFTKKSLNNQDSFDLFTEKKPSFHDYKFFKDGGNMKSRYLTYYFDDCDDSNRFDYNFNHSFPSIYGGCSNVGQSLVAIYGRSASIRGYHDGGWFDGIGASKATIVARMPIFDEELETKLGEYNAFDKSNEKVILEGETSRFKIAAFLDGEDPPEEILGFKFKRDRAISNWQCQLWSAIACAFEPPPYNYVRRPFTGSDFSYDLYNPPLQYWYYYYDGKGDEFSKLEYVQFGVGNYTLFYMEPIERYYGSYSGARACIEAPSDYKHAVRTSSIGNIRYFSDCLPILSTAYAHCENCYFYTYYNEETNKPVPFVNFDYYLGFPDSGQGQIEYLHPTFDPSIEPEIPGQSRTKVSVTIAATSEKAVEYLRKVINDDANIEDCESDLCRNFRYSRVGQTLVGSIDLKEEIKYALNNEDEDGNNPNIIIYDKQIIQDINTENCNTLPYFNEQSYSWRWSNSDAGYERIPSSNYGLKITRQGVGVYLSSDSVFHGKVFSYNGIIKTYDAEDENGGLVFFIDVYNSDDYYTSKTMRDIRTTLFYTQYLRNPSEYYECASCSVEELKDLETDHRKQFKGFELLRQCNANACCILQENIGEYKLKITRPELDYEGKEPALYKHYYVFNYYNRNNAFYSDEVKLPNIEPIEYTINIVSDGGQQYSCSFTSDDLDEQYLTTGMEDLFSCFNPENEYCKRLFLTYILGGFYLSYGGGVGVTSGRYTYNYNPRGWRESAPWYLVNDEALKPDCLYDLLLSSPRPDSTNCSTCFATQYLATFEEYDGVGVIGNIISGKMYGNVVSNVISDDPYIYKDDNQCMWYLPCTAYSPPATLNQIKCGGLHADATCGVIGSQLGSLELPIFKSIPDPASDCLLTQQIGTYTHYHSEAGSTSYEMDGYCNPEQDFDNCRSDHALKKTTTTEWLEKSMGRACGGMVSLPYTLQGGVCQNEDQLWKREISPDPRERYNRDTYVLRLKDAEYKSGELELDFSKAQEMQDGDGNTFFYIQGESIESFFDTSKIEMGNAVELVRDAYQEMIEASTDYGLRIIGADTVELGTGLELRYSFIGKSQIKLQLIYPVFLQGYSVDYIGKTLDIFGSRRCVDDCCTEYEYDPPAIGYNLSDGSCPYGGEGVDGSIKNAEGYNTGFDYWRKTAFYNAAAATVPESYKINKITMRGIQVVINCANFESLDNIETLISDSADNDQNFDFIVDAGPRIVTVVQQLQLPIPLSCFPNNLVFFDRNEGNELCPAAASTSYYGEQTFKTQDSLYNRYTPYTPIQTELIRDELQ